MNRMMEHFNAQNNATLVTSKLNSSLSNSPFHDKRSSLSENSMLILNKEISNQPIWDSNQITKRTEELFTYFCSIWPSAGGFAKDIT